MHTMTIVVEAVVAIVAMCIAYRWIKADMERKSGANNRLRGSGDL